MKYLFWPLAVVVLAGCQTRPATVIVPAGPRQTMPPIQKIAEVVRPAAAGGHWRQSEIVKVYGINRYLDPADGRVMHERHAVYRLEQQPSWITRAPGNQNEVILGPIVGLRRPEYAPEPQPGETSREIFQARRGIEEANQEMKDLRESQEKLTSGLEAMAKNTAEAERKLTSVVSVLNERVKHLEGDSSAVDPSQVKTIETGEGEVVIHSPSP
jgi:hypothetical protein